MLYHCKDAHKTGNNNVNLNIHRHIVILKISLKSKTLRKDIILSFFMKKKK
jgi:hypothetical protein